jgi:hypothetical protein
MCDTRGVAFSLYLSVFVFSGVWTQVEVVPSQFIANFVVQIKAVMEFFTDNTLIYI